MLLPIKSILWPSDASEAANQALEVATELAKQFGAKLYGLQVVSEIPTYTDAIPSMSGLDIQQYEQDLMQAARKSLEETLADKVPDNIEVEAAILIGRAADLIVDFAKERKIGLIVMSTHGRTGLSHLMIGSVAENVIRYSQIPTLIIPGKKQ